MKIALVLKRIIVVLLAVILGVTAMANDDVMMDGSGFFDPVEITGDVNLDGTVDISDAILVLQHSMFPVTYPVSYVGSLDFTKDGELDANDAILILRYSMFPDEYPLV